MVELVYYADFGFDCAFYIGKGGDACGGGGVIGAPEDGGADHVEAVGVAFLHGGLGCFSFCHRLHRFTQIKLVCSGVLGEVKEIFNTVNGIFYYGYFIYIVVVLLFSNVNSRYDYVIINIISDKLYFINVKLYFNCVSI